MSGATLPHLFAHAEHTAEMEARAARVTLNTQCRGSPSCRAPPHAPQSTDRISPYDGRE